MFVHGIGCLLGKEGKETMLIKDLDISRLLTYVHQDEGDNLNQKKELCNKKAKTTAKEFTQSTINNDNCSFFRI